MRSVVFDFKGVRAGGARRIDPVHHLFEFASRIDLGSLDHVLLARDGTAIFAVASSDMSELAGSYSAGGEPWAFNHLPERSKTLDGRAAFSTWTGGFLGVLAKQAEDLNNFIRDWTGS